MNVIYSILALVATFMNEHVYKKHTYIVLLKKNFKIENRNQEAYFPLYTFVIMLTKSLMKKFVILNFIPYETVPYLPGDCEYEMTYFTTWETHKD
jgi:hypothetical protein